MTWGLTAFVPPTGSDSAPNSAAPNPNRILRSPNQGPSTAVSLIVAVVNGTSLAVTPWVFDATSKTWVVWGASQVVNAGARTTPIIVPSDADLFVQVTANTGGVTKAGVGFSAGEESVGGSGGGGGGGDASAANQVTGNASLASIDSKTVAVNTGAVVVASSALPAGAATSALQTTGNASMSSIDGKVTTGNASLASIATSVASPTAFATPTTASVGTSAAALPAQACKSVRVTAEPTNTGVIYIGGTGITTANGANILTGGDSVECVIDNVSDLFAIATLAAQTLRIQPVT